MKQRGAMEDSRWRNMFLFFILFLQFTGAQSRHLYYTVRAGDDVTLSCENVISGHSNCDTTTWLHSKSGQTALELVNLGQVKNTRSGRLSVSANCSLVVKKVTAEDVGQYTCRQFISGGGQSGPDALVHLSLINLTEDQNQDRLTLTCSVVTDEQCKHKVQWLYGSIDVDKDNKDITESSSSCSAAVTFKTSHYIYPSRFDSFKCEVKTEDDKVQVFTFSSSSDKDKTTTTTSVTTKSKETTVSGEKDFLWLYITLPLVLVLLIVTAVVFVLLKRTKGNKTEHNSSDGATLRPAETQSVSENQQHEADTENGVFYASISYTKKSNNRAKNGDEDEAVTYSTVKAPSQDPSNLYASIK